MIRHGVNVVCNSNLEIQSSDPPNKWSSLGSLLAGSVSSTFSKLPPWPKPNVSGIYRKDRVIDNSTCAEGLIETAWSGVYLPLR